MSIKRKLQRAEPSSASAKVEKAAPRKKVAKKAKKAKKVTSFAMDLVASTNSAVKGGGLQMADEAAALADVTEWIPTGFAGLDEIFGGGWPVGRVSEVFGAEGHGKSALSHVAVRECQRLHPEALAVFLDFEHSLERSKLEPLGIDPSRLIYMEPDHVEQGFDLMLALLDRLVKTPPPAPVLIVWDSLGCSQPKSAFDAKSAADASVGAHSRAVGKGAVKLVKKVPNARAHVMFINQERTKIGGFQGFGGPQFDTTGGKQAKYIFSLRVRCARVATVKKAGTTGPSVGYLIKTATKKNKNAPPHQDAVWYLDFKHGPSPDLTMYHVLKDAGLIRSAQAGLYTGPWANGVKFGKGDAWLEALKEAGFREAATEAYLEVVRAGGARALLNIGAEESQEQE